MKKRWILAVALVAFLLVGAFSASAQVRLDVDIPWVITTGLQLEDLTGSPSGNVSFSDYHYPLPYLELAYQFGLDPFALGVGIRTYTLLVEFAGWPMVYAELNLKPIVLRAELGGFAFFLFGFYNDFALNDYTLKVMIPDLQVSWAITDWFRRGAGTLIVAPLGDFNNFGWVFYVNGRFAILFK